MSRYINPPLFSDLFHDPPVEPLLASTLVGFETDNSDPEAAHVVWLQGAVKELLNSRSGCWVDLIGHASKRGNADYNFELSRRRTHNVADTILRSLINKNTEIFHSMPRGSSDSGSVAGDDSARYRSVEVLIYGPEAPKPTPPAIVTDQRVSFRQTVQVTKVEHEPSEPGLNEGIAKAPWVIKKTIEQTSAANKRIADHPLEQGDADFGTEASRTVVQVDHSFKLLKVEIEVLFEVLPVEMHFGSYTTSSRLTRNYTYHYGVGVPGQKVAVTRKRTAKLNKMDPPIITSESLITDQPSSFLNP
jgi:hypothetical protein